MVAAIKRLTTAVNDALNVFGVNVTAGQTVKLYENLVLNTTAILKELTLCNPSELPAYVTVSIKESTDAMSLSNAIFFGAYVDAGKTVVIDLSSVIGYNQGLYVKVQSGGSINASALGVELLNASAKQLVSALLSSNSYSTQYSTPANKQSVVYQVLAVNGDTAPTTLSLQFVPANGTIDSKNCVLYEVTIQPNETLMFDTKTQLPAGYSIVAKASKANVIHLIVDGTEK